MRKPLEDTLPFEVKKVDLQLDEIVRHMLREMRTSYPATRVTSSELPIIHADPVVVRRVLGNVIANAFKYSALAPQPAVEISLHASGVLQVIDNGVGFASEDAAAIFEPLSAAKQLLDGHGGWIRAESREGGPTRFTISFED